MKNSKPFPKKISFLAAFDKNFVIGKCGKIPWNLSTERNRFKQICSGKKIIMGRKSFDEITKDISNTEHNGFYDIDVITPVTEEFQIKHDNYLFSYANTLFVLIFIFFLLIL